MSHLRWQRGPWLARHYAVTVLPSVASLTALRSLPSGYAGRRPFVGFGDPVFQASAGGASAPVQTAEAAAGEQSVATRSMPIALRNLARMRAASSAQLSMLPRLPDTADEIKSIALALNADLTRDVFLGTAANEIAAEG